MSHICKHLKEQFGLALRFAIRIFENVVLIYEIRYTGQKVQSYFKAGMFEAWLYIAVPRGSRPSGLF